MTPPVIYRTLRLPQKEFKAEPKKKNLIVLHHTAGADVESTVRWWLTDPKPIGTAYIIGRDGTIFEVFPPEMWAFHLAVKNDGLNGTNAQRRALERRSVGIELACAGWVIKRGREFYKFGRLTRGNRLRKMPFDLGKKWRGQRYFEPYSKSQMQATARLVDHLCRRYNIPRETPRNPGRYSPKLVTAKGILSHATLRPDKTDVHPGFDWKWMEERAGLAAVL